MVEIQTEISEVTVYTDRARVTRTGKAHLEAGEHTLTVDGLPSTLQEETVRASGRGANARILSVEVQTRYVTEEPEEDLAALRKELEAKSDEDKALADADAQEAAQQAYLNELREESARNLPRGIAQGKTGIDSLAALNEYVERQLSEVAERRRDIAKKRRDLSREIEALQMRLNARHVTMERRQIAVLVEAAEAADLELEVTYGVYNASWEPLYDLRLEGDKVNLTYLANVRQQSGEEWSNVMLSLSTARPAVSADIPELDPWFIDIYRPPVPMPVAARAAFKEAAYSVAEASGPISPPSMMAMDVSAPPPPMEVMQAEVESTGASVTFRVPKRVTVPPDGTPHKTTITMLDMEAKLDYVTVPKIAEEAYLRARISNNSQLTLLPGSANIFHEGNYVGRTILQTVAPNEEFEAQLGVDDRVKVERELSERTAGKTLIGNTRRTGLGYKITLHNHLEREAQVTVYDQVPVSRHENIKVRVAEVTPEPAEHTDLNILKWTLTLAPAAKREIRFSYQVESPRDVQISNLHE